MRIAFILFLTCSFSIFAGWSQNDSTQTLSFDAFIGQVISHHPITVQAENAAKIGEAYVQKARGGFDPKINGGADQKYFKDKNYYSLLHAGLKIPTWYGIAVQGGYDLNSGDYLNPERNTPNNGLFYAGLSVDLGRGMLMNQRKAEYDKAKIYQQSSAQTRRIILNNLYFDAASAYWEWFKAYAKLEIYEQAVINAEERYKSVVQNVILGTDPAIDTIEARTQLQSRYYSYLDTRLDYLNAGALLEIYLWENGQIPLELDSLMTPPSLSDLAPLPVETDIYPRLDSLLNYHPDLLKTQYAYDQQRVELQLSRENIKPIISLKYNALAQPANQEADFYYSLNNYKWGANVEIPIFLRKERGQLRIGRLELENLQNEMVFKSESIQFKVQTAINEWQITNEQARLWQGATNDFSTLYQSEKTLFEVGESSLFMVNSREKSLIDARLKLVETLIKNQKAALKTKYALGITLE